MNEGAQRVDCARAFDLDERLVESIVRGEDGGEIPLRHRQSWIDRERAPQMRFGAVPVPLEVIGHERLRVMDLRERLVERKGARDRGERLRAARGRGIPSVHAIDRIAIGESRIRERIVVIERNDLLEAPNGGQQVRGRSLVPAVASLEIQLVRLEILGRPLDGGLRITDQRRRQCLDDRFHNLVLDVEHVGHLAVVAFGPDVEAVGDVGQLCGHAKAFPGAPHAAFQHRRDVQLAPDLADVDVAAAKPER